MQTLSGPCPCRVSEWANESSGRWPARDRGSGNSPGRSRCRPRLGLDPRLPVRCAHHTGDQLETSDLLEPDEFEAERFDDGEHAIQRGTVDQRTRQDGVVTLRPRAEAGKRGTEGSAEAAADADLIVLLWHRYSVSWGRGPSGRRRGWCVRP